MIFSPPLEAGTFLRRYRRFFADVRCADGSELTLHCANTGSMLNCQVPDSPCWFSRSADPRRKLPGTLEIVTTGDGRRAGVNTGRANALVAEALAERRIAPLAGYAEVRREVRCGAGSSRIDFLLAGGERPCYLEVKSVTLSLGGGVAAFPDAVTERGARHLRELEALVGQGARAVLLFCVQLTGVHTLVPADRLDPGYGEALRRARRRGVEVLAWGCRVGAAELRLDRELAVAIPD
ncbi:MAG: DNA/RNA nuclease SfsA [Pseudomonadota bacterium]